MIFTDSNNDGTPEIIQESDYYPFGMRHDRVTTATNHYLYNGKELNEDLGLDWYDYGARFYDAGLGRFPSIDPLADHPNLISWSPYNYTYNNPINYTDPDGRWPTPDTVWDVGNVALGVGSLIKNVATGNYVGAFVDGVGVVIDVVATATPLLPGGAGTAIKIAREGSEVALKKGDEIIEFNADAAKQAAKDIEDEFGSVSKHGNKKGDQPAEQYRLEDKDTGDLQKYGETTQGELKYGPGNQKRYTQKELDRTNSRYVQENIGTKRDMHDIQNQKIKKHKDDNDGKRPPLNKSDW